MNFTAAAPVQATLTVNAAGQTITFATPTPVTYTSGLIVNLTGDASASSGLTVTYTLLSGGTGAGSITGTTLTVTQAGTFVIQASQAGNANFTAATPVQATLIVNAAGQTITFATPPAVTYTSGLTVALSGDASASSGLPVTYTLLSGGTGTGSIAGTTLTVTQAGTFVIQASQAGNANFTAATPVQATLIVNAAGQTITFATPPAVTYTSGLTVNLAGDATATSGLTVTYTLLSGGTGTGSISGTTLTVTQAGTFLIQGSQAGNANFTAATPVQATLTVNAGAQTITFPTPPAIAYTSGLTVNLAGDATASSGLTVTYTLLSGGTGTGSITGTTLTVTQAGTFLIQGSQAGNANFTAATPVQATLTVNAGAQTITFATPPAIAYTSGLTVNLTGDATATSGLTVTYTFLSGGTGAGSITGTTLTVTQAGTFVIQASQAGNANYTPATPVQATLTVSAGSQTITFATPPAVTYTSGLTVALSGDATATSGLPVTYTLLSGGTGTGSITGTTLTVTQAGTFVIQANQAGDVNFTAATPVQATVTVNAATQTITFATPAAVTYTSGLTVNLSGDATASSGLHSDLHTAQRRNGHRRHHRDNADRNASRNILASGQPSRKRELRSGNPGPGNAHDQRGRPDDFVQ